MKKLLFFLSLCLILMGCMITEPVLVKVTDIFPKEKIQPAEALEIAEPHLAEHGTYNYREDKELVTYIVKHKKWYYIMRTNYPAKTLRYYMQPAVRINFTSGEIDYTKR